MQKAFKITVLALLLGGLSVPASAQEAPTNPDELPPGMSAIDPELRGGPIEVEVDPWRLSLQVGAGASIRASQNLDFEQDRFAPSYLDVTFGFQWKQSGRIRHGYQLGVGFNLSGDGSFNSGIDAAEQWVVTPYYTLQLRFDDDFVPDYFVNARVGVPLNIAPDFSPGIDISGQFVYMFLAGLGAYVELGASMFFGGHLPGDSVSMHPLVSAELGVHFDFEVLP